MKNIQLFGKEKQSEGHRLEDKRPEKLNLSKVRSESHKWVECKIIGKNISIRSYSGSCAFQNKLWVYGGYQILNGLMGDFYCIEVDDGQEIFNWKEVATVNVPGPRARHSLVPAQQHIYLIGGLYSDIKSSNEIFKFTPSQLKWQLVSPVGHTLPALESFGCTMATRDGDEVIIIACGYNGSSGVYSSVIYEYSISKNKVSILLEGGDDSSNGKYPMARSGCSLASQGGKVYLFGGKNDDRRMNDLWVMDLQDCKISRMKDDGIVPAVRNGHSLNISDGKLFLFGGIHDITWELDDLHIYSIQQQQWTTLEQDSARKVEKKKNNEEKKQKNNETSKSPKKNWYETSNSIYGNKSNSPLIKNASKEEDPNKSISPGKMIDEQRRKAFYQKKAEMLKAFEIKQTQKTRYISMETSSQAMKNSLDAIGNPNPKLAYQEGKITDFGKETSSKFLQPLQNSSNIVLGKRPCARDGHCAVIINKQLIIFGGDRHQMSFNDIYKLNLQMAKNQINI